MYITLLFILPFYMNFDCTYTYSFVGLIIGTREAFLVLNGGNLPRLTCSLFHVFF